VGTQKDVEPFPAQKFLTIIVRARDNSFAEKLKNIVELFPDNSGKWKKTEAKVLG
jgi:hypothetical protein